MSAGPYSIGSSHWPGLSKLIEEAGEVQQVAGKIIATGGDAKHFDGSDLRERLTEELGDLIAACNFVALVNGIDYERMQERVNKKLSLFETWHLEQQK